MTAIAETSAGTSQDDESCRRDAGRAQLHFPGKLALSDGNYDCVLEDLSLGGARISSDRTIEHGREVWLKFDRFEVFGTVTWARGGQYGIEFEERLPKSVILEMQGYAVDFDDYEAYQGKMAAKAHVYGDGQAPLRSPLMRLLEVVGPIDRKEYAECVECESGISCAVHCGHKKYKRAQLLRVVFYLALAALIGAAIGIGSVLLGRI
jgi:hypothetical protein